MDVIVLLAGVWVLLLLFIPLFMWRDATVYRYRVSCLKQIRRAALLDIQYGRPWQWRRDLFDTVSYERMVWRFWCPLGSFFPVPPWGSSHEVKPLRKPRS